jgi:hypothetical protein
MQIDLYREKFMAIPEKPEFNNGFRSKYFAEDPTMMVFSLFFEFDSPLLNPASGVGESAERFFRNLGDTERMKKVVEFRNRILHLIDQTPYLIRSIDGLSDLYDYTTNEIYTVRELNIKTYETLDLRIAKLAELYTDIVWDFENQKRILPDNLEWLNYHVITNDVRDLAMFIDGGDGRTMTNVTAYLDSFVFSFKHGKFNFGKSNNMLGSISNEDPSVGDNSFRLIGGKFSKKKNRVLLTNEEKNKNITKISGRRTTEKTSKIESISIFGKKFDKLVGSGNAKLIEDYARIKVAQEVNEEILDPAKSSLFNLLNRNSLFGNDVAFGGLDNKLQGKILNKDKVDLPQQEPVKDVDVNLVSVQGLSNKDIIDMILNDVNRRLAYSK